MIRQHDKLSCCIFVPGRDECVGMWAGPLDSFANTHALNQKVPEG